MKKERVLNEETFPEWAIDAADGSLNSHQMQHFKAYLLAHPHRQEEWDLMFDTRDDIPAEEHAAFAEEQLLKNEPDSLKGKSINRVLFEYSEGNLNPAENRIVEGWLSNHEAMQNELRLFGLTHSKPDSKIEFPDHRLLLKKAHGPRVFYLRPLYRAAAVLIVLMAGYQMLRLLSQNGSVNRDNAVALEMPIPTVPANEAVNRNSGVAQKINSHNVSADATPEALALQGTTLPKTNAWQPEFSNTEPTTHAADEQAKQHAAFLAERTSVTRINSLGFASLNLISQSPELLVTNKKSVPLRVAFNSPVNKTRNLLRPILQITEGVINSTTRKEERKRNAEAYAKLGEAIIEKVTGKSTELKLASGNKTGSKGFSFKAGNFGISHYRP